MDRPGGTPPPGWVPPGSPARRRRTPVAALSATAVGVIGVLVWTLVPGDGHADARAGSTTPPETTTPGSTAPGTATAGSLASNGPKSGSETGTPSSPTTHENLLTPAGVRGTIAAMRPFMAGTRVRELLVYPEYASAEAPTPTDPKLYDDIAYRDGRVTHQPGGVMDPDDTTVDLRGYDWDVLPALLDKAQQTLNVPRPTSRYIIVGPDLFDDTPAIRIYLSDAYGGGYLLADAKGRVQRTYPRGS